MSRYLGLYNFFYSFEGKKKYTKNQKIEIINKINSSRSIQELKIISKGLNHCSDVFDMKENKCYNAIYKKLKKTFLTLRIDEHYLFFNNIPTTFLTRLINDLLIELQIAYNDSKESINILLENIIYMIILIDERDEFKIVIIDDLVKNDKQLYTFLVVLYTINKRKELIRKIYLDVFKYSDYASQYLSINDKLSKRIED